MKCNQPPSGAHDQSRSPSERGSATLLSPEQFSRLRDLLAAYSGVYLDTARQRVLETGLAQRLAATGDTILGYTRRIQAPNGRDELRQLAELVLNHETFFFRNGPHLRALREVLLPELHQRKPAGAPIRIWSAGCATGEEAYSLAIIAFETLGRPLARPVEIWATDLSEAALRKARAGLYRGRTLNNLSSEMLTRYFHPHGDGYGVSDALRSLVRFETLNLLEPFPECAQGIDMIFCQNVTIYFQLETCRALIQRFHEHLAPDGLLFLGFSETLWNIFDGFRSREVAGAYVYYKERQPTAPALPTDPRPQRRAGAREKSTGQSGRTNPERSGQTGNQKTLPVTRRRSEAFHDQACAAANETSGEEVLRRGRELLEQGRSDEALEVLRQIPPQSVQAPRALLLCARAHADRGDLDMAVAEVHRALELDTLNEEAYLLLGVICGRQGQWGSAVQQLERARYLSPDSAVVSFHLADAYRQLGRRELAAREYRNTLRKLDAHRPDDVLDGVVVGWLRETCRRQLEFMLQHT